MLEQISKYRGPIMGGAIVCVLLIHTNVQYGFPLLDFLIKTSYGSIDVFLFLSGFGLYRSLTRNPDKSAFYKRRLMKILPAYLPLLVIWLIANHNQVSLTDLPGYVFGNLTGLSFWFQKNPYFNWYILCLPAFYLSAPYLVSVVQRGRRRDLAGIYLLSILACTCCFGISRFLLFFSRIPCFVLGMVFCKAHLEGREPGTRAKCLFLGNFAVFYLLLILLLRVLSEDTIWHYGLWFYSFFFMLPGMLLIFCTALHWCDRLPPLRPLVKLLSLIGTSTLEIYVIHIVLFDFVPEGTGRLLWLAIAASMVVLGIVYHKLIERIQRKLRAHSLRP